MFPIKKRLLSAPLLLLFVCLAGLLFACPTAPLDEPRETTADGGTPEIRKETLPVVSLAEPLEKDETRAGQIRKKEELLTGAGASGRIGDWKLYNQKVAFVISNAGPSPTIVGRGGHLIDASPLDENGQGKHDLMEELAPVVALLRIFKATKVEVIQQGGQGKAAILRVTGRDIGFPAVDSIIVSPPLGVTVQMDYTLRPGTNYLEIETRLLKADESTRALLGDSVLFGDGTQIWLEKYGNDTKLATGKVLRWTAGIGQGVGYLLSSGSTQQQIQLTFPRAGILPFARASDSQEDSIKPYKRYLFVNRGNLQGLLDDLEQFLPTKGLQTFSGQVSNVRDLARANVVLLDRRGDPLLQTRLDKEGRFTFKAAAGTYSVRVTSPGQFTLQAPIEAGKEWKQSMKVGATLVVSVKPTTWDGRQLDFVPARLRVSGAYRKNFYLLKNKQAFAVPAGKLNLLLSRGLTWEYTTKTVEVKPGETLELTLELKESYKTTGYVSADMHLHAAPSLDSELPVRTRIATLVAEGLEFVSSSDHDVITDYKPVIDAMKMNTWLTSTPGTEISPLKYHFGAFPLKPDPRIDSYFNIGWAVYKNEKFAGILNGPQVWEVVRKRNPNSIMQINHPRRSASFLNYIEYSVKAGVSSLKTGDFNENWDTIELYNGGDRDVFLKEGLQDWFSLLNQGFLKTGVGNSDSHGEGGALGANRTLIASSTNTPGNIKVSEMVDSLKKNKAIIFSGPFLDIKANGVPAPGARLKTGEVKLSIRVLAASWVPVSYLVIYTNGKEWKRIPIPASKEKVRLDTTVDLKVDKDTWVVVIAGDEKKDMSPVYPGRKPISMTNPLYLDVDGKGFQAPGLP